MAASRLERVDAPGVAPISTVILFISLVKLDDCTTFGLLFDGLRTTMSEAFNVDRFSFIGLSTGCSKETVTVVSEALIMDELVML